MSSVDFERSLRSGSALPFDHRLPIDLTLKAAESLREALETITMKPMKSNVTVKILSLAWAPYWHTEQEETAAAWE